MKHAHFIKTPKYSAVVSCALLAVTSLSSSVWAQTDSGGMRGTAYTVVPYDNRPTNIDLEAAVEADNLRLVTASLAAGAEVNAAIFHADRLTAPSVLQLAVTKGDPEIVSLLLSAGANVAFVPRWAPTPVLTLAVKSAASSATLALNQDDDVVTDRFGHPITRELKVLEEILAAGRRAWRSSKHFVNMDHGLTMIEAQKQHGARAVDVLRELVDEGADVDFLGQVAELDPARNSKKVAPIEGSALALAITHTDICSPEILDRAKILIDKGARVDAIGVNPRTLRPETLGQMADRRAADLEAADDSRTDPANHLREIQDGHCKDRGYYLHQAADLIRQKSR